MHNLGKIEIQIKAKIKILIIVFILILLRNPFIELDSMCGYYGISIFYDQRLPHNEYIDAYLGYPSTFEFRDSSKSIPYYMSYSLNELKSLHEYKSDDFELICYMISNNNLFICERNADGDIRHQVLKKDISSSGKEFTYFEKIDLENMLEMIDILDYTYINTDFEYIRGIRNSRDFCLYAICILILIATYYIFMIIKYNISSYKQILSK